MRVSRILIGLIGLIGVQACTADKTGHPTTTTNPPLAYIRYINAVSDTFNMDFRAIDQVEYSQPFLNVAFRALGDGNYQGWQAGSRHIRVFPDMNITTSGVAIDPNVVSQIMIDTTFTFTAGQYYTVIHTGFYRSGVSPKAGLWIIPDATPAAPPSGLALREVNAAAGQPAVDVHVTDGVAALATPTYSNVGFGTVTAYGARALGAANVRLTAAGTLTAVGAAAGFTMQAGTAGTTSADPIGGSGVAGTIATAVIFAPSVTGSKAATSAASTVLFWVDKQPARTTSP